MSAPTGNHGDGGGRKGKQGNLNLFPESEEASAIPSLPRPACRLAEILEALRRGWGWRLAADVFALANEHGWPIASRMIPVEGGNDVAEYSLPAGSRQWGAV